MRLEQHEEQKGNTRGTVVEKQITMIVIKMFPCSSKDESLDLPYFLFETLLLRFLVARYKFPISFEFLIAAIT